MDLPNTSPPDPQLLAKWHAGHDTHPRGAALVTAAIDCRRAGYIAPLPRALLSEVHSHYLPGNPRARLEELDSAWAWATELWRHTAALLEPTNTDAERVIVFDYLVDDIQRNTPIGSDPPEQVMLAAVTFADATTAGAVGSHAQQRGRHTLAHAAYTRAVTLRAEARGADHPDTLASRNNLAEVLRAPIGLAGVHSSA